MREAFLDLVADRVDRRQRRHRLLEDHRHRRAAQRRTDRPVRAAELDAMSTTSPDRGSELDRAAEASCRSWQDAHDCPGPSRTCRSPDSPTTAVTAPAQHAKTDALHDLYGRAVDVERHPQIVDSKNLTSDPSSSFPNPSNDAQLPYSGIFWPIEPTAAAFSNRSALLTISRCWPTVDQDFIFSAACAHHYLLHQENENADQTLPMARSRSGLHYLQRRPSVAKILRIALHPSRNSRSIWLSSNVPNDTVTRRPDLEFSIVRIERSQFAL